MPKATGTAEPRDHAVELLAADVAVTVTVDTVERGRVEPLGGELDVPPRALARFAQLESDLVQRRLQRRRRSQTL